MKASRLIATLQEIIDQHGDVPCLIELTEKNDDNISGVETRMVDIGELNVETREGFGVSVAMIL